MHTASCGGWGGDAAQADVSRATSAPAVVAHIATPEADGRTHYRHWGAHYFNITAEQNKFVNEKAHHAFTHEDKPILEAQQQRVGTQEFWSMRPVLLSSDKGAVRVRRSLKALIAAEAGTTASG